MVGPALGLVLLLQAARARPAARTRKRDRTGAERSARTAMMFLPGNRRRPQGDAAARPGITPADATVRPPVLDTESPGPANPAYCQGLGRSGPGRPSNFSTACR